MTTAIARLRAYRARLLARGQVMQAEVVERCIRQLAKPTDTPPPAAAQ